MKSVAIEATVALSFVFVLFALNCTSKPPQTNLSTAGLSPAASSTSGSSPSPSKNLPLRTLRDVPLSGRATRFDYQSHDQNKGRLYIAHLGDNSMIVFDIQKQILVGDVKNLPRVHGVLAVPDLHRV